MGFLDKIFGTVEDKNLVEKANIDKIIATQSSITDVFDRRDAETTNTIIPYKLGKRLSTFEGVIVNNLHEVHSSLNDGIEISVWLL